MTKAEFIRVFAEAIAAGRRKHRPELSDADRIGAELADQDKAQSMWRRYRRRYLFMTAEQCRRELEQLLAEEGRSNARS